MKLVIEFCGILPFGFNIYKLKVSPKGAILVKPGFKPGVYANTLTQAPPVRYQIFTYATITGQKLPAHNLQCQ